MINPDVFPIRINFALSRRIGTLREYSKNIKVGTAEELIGKATIAAIRKLARDIRPVAIATYDKAPKLTRDYQDLEL